MSSDMVPCLAPALCGLAKRQQSLNEVIARPGLIQVERVCQYSVQDLGSPQLTVHDEHLAVSDFSRYLESANKLNQSERSGATR